MVKEKLICGRPSIETMLSLLCSTEYSHHQPDAHMRRFEARSTRMNAARFREAISDVIIRRIALLNRVYLMLSQLRKESKQKLAACNLAAEIMQIRKY